jgi:hypothetical protein
MSNYNYVNRVLIGDGDNSAATVLPQIEKGDLFLLDEKGVIIPDGATALALPKFSKVTVAAGIGKGIAILSSPIQGNTVSAYEGVDYTAPAEQVAYIGYNGTDGTIDATPSTEYRLRIEILDDHRVNAMRQSLADYHVELDASEGPEEAIDTIACFYAQKDYGVNYMGDKVKLERVGDLVTAAAGASTGLVVNGSPIVEVTGLAIPAVGEYFRIGGVTTTDPIYKVKEVNGTTVTLDVPYVGESEGAAVVDTLVASSGLYGFKLTALPQEALLSRAANEPWDQYEWIIFNAYYSEADDRSFSSVAPYRVETPVHPGNGYWKQVAEREEAAKGYLGDTSKRRFHDTRIASNVGVDVAYNTIVITHADVHRGDFQGVYNAPLKTEIYIPVLGSQGVDAAENFIYILNEFFAGSVGFPRLGF